MITQAQVRVQPAGWQQELAQGIADPLELLRLLDLAPRMLAEHVLIDTPFATKVPRAFAARMRRGDPGDPLLRQVLPIAAETRAAPGYVADPVGDLAAEAVPGVLHKYEARALLIATGACAVHCRYCFRRQFPYAGSHAARDRWAAALDYLRGDGSIREVILSGGDPLTLGDARLAELVQALEDIRHLQRLRLHTRLPIVLPTRVDDRLLGWLARSRLQKVVVVHANHPNEIDDRVVEAVRRLAGVGVTLLNQAVLLAGVNDEVGALCGLSEALFAAGVLPYYLHLLDPVIGASHFDVPRSRALQIMGELRASLPGYLVPRMVRELAGSRAKVPAELLSGPDVHGGFGS
ncbi:MAG: L-lysine 2,3-aminomutase [Gammaproteobacteria bacterium]|nr:L-lysine 2,3-aminomutase [Gammaproteobacteria bacterium]